MFVHFKRNPVDEHWLSDISGNFLGQENSLIVMTP